MTTLKDVAKLACVDVSTVSRALNNSAYVHPDTKARIMAAVKELSYQPNVLAKGLREGKRNTIGVVVPHLHLTVFAEITQGIEEAATKAGYATLICNTNDDPSIEKECLNRLRNGFVDGIIIAGTGHNKKLLKDIQVSGIAITQIMRRQNSDISCVSVDYKKSAYEATQYFAKKGCHNIGLINGSMKIPPYQERYEGYKKAIKELGLTETLAESNGAVNTLEYGYHCTKELLNKNPNLDAIIAAVDAQGIGALRVLKEEAIAVPDSIKLISLTGQEIGSVLQTTMTAMEIPAVDIGRQAAMMTIEDIKSKDKHVVQKNLIFSSKLVERESS
ncbi:LacI family DNA-binding transcriptional regulator [Streptococcus merionis]|uniref:Maltose operon transcription repressor n=1 Tax=Streptococcus merionis TaxID=400065 RepID=A0A239SSA8_9STRE|nr:LacI family DNA-binding transcriptional regulator [Streptococcus merionis]SNU88149.1 maltose operon transcription repressor [Streptococcus merionis]